VSHGEHFLSGRQPSLYLYATSNDAQHLLDAGMMICTHTPRRVCVQITSGLYDLLMHDYQPSASFEYRLHIT
jgi:hypothetical protein